MMNALYPGVMRSPRWVPVVVVTAFLAATPSGALARTTRLAPPGHAGSSQYFETVPTSYGSAPPPGGSSGTKSGGQTAIARIGHGGAGDRTLSQLGSDGKSAAALAAATAPPPAPSPKPSPSSAVGKRSTAAAPSDVQPPSAQGSVVGGLANALGGSDAGGIGVFLPLVLALSLGAALALGVARARRPGGPSGPSA